ncbi:hypothetical protein TIFTF001_023922 [Ficus carica]|uniref:Uncharacterized protein n=1 Tax=Ficus carica TaxID=3494 RepID=A0AA88DK98_FICCA|nr:hypothetical protein TIFTF001_023922 [Ficus carica]
MSMLRFVARLVVIGVGGVLRDCNGEVFAQLLLNLREENDKEYRKVEKLGSLARMLAFD